MGGGTRCQHGQQVGGRGADSARQRRRRWAGCWTASLAANPHAKPGTRVVVGAWRGVCGNTSAKIGRCGRIGRAEARGFRQWLVEEGLGGDHVATPTPIAPGNSSPTRCVASGSTATRLRRIAHGRRPTARQRYVTEEETARLIDAAPNWVWRTIIALARYGGLRTPSETLSLRIADLDWEHGAMTVCRPRRKGTGQGQRMVPMFARLRPYLDEAWSMAKEGQTHVIPENLYLPAAHGPRGWVNCNLRTTFEKIVRRAGLAPGPGCSTLCGRVAKVTWPGSTQSPPSAGGSATRWQSRRSTMSR